LAIDTAGAPIISSSLIHNEDDVRHPHCELLADAAVLRSASSFVCAAVKGVCRAGEDLVGELRVVDGACHRDRSDQSGEGQDGFVSLGVGIGLSDEADEPVDVPSYLPAVGVARSGTGSGDVGWERNRPAGCPGGPC
jgi:hypothetical protein